MNVPCKSSVPVVSKESTAESVPERIGNSRIQMLQRKDLPKAIIFLLLIPALPFLSPAP